MIKNLFVQIKLHRWCKWEMILLVEVSTICGSA